MPNYSQPGVFVEEVPSGPRQIVGASTSVLAVVDGFAAGVLHEPVQVQSWYEFKQAFGGLHVNSVGSYALRQFFANGGSRAWVVRVAGVVTLPAEAALAGGLKVLRQLAPGAFNLLAVPAAAELPPVTASAVFKAAGELCSERRALLLLDVPVGLAGAPDAEVVSWVDGLRSENAAVYFPRLLARDPLRRRVRREVAPSGTVAGVIARTDAERGVWKAAAGVGATLRRVRPLEDIDDARGGSLNAAGINALRTFDEHGPVIWGSRTTVGGQSSGASEWQYIAVRRLGLFLEESLAQGLQWAAFEPNDEPLWAQLRQTAGAFLDGLFRQGAFQGSRPDAAYNVRCGRDTTTQADIDAGFVNVVVMFAPLKPAEFVVLELRQRAGSA